MTKKLFEDYKEGEVIKYYGREYVVHRKVIKTLTSRLHAPIKQKQLYLKSIETGDKRIAMIHSGRISFKKHMIWGTKTQAFDTWKD